ncbi:hypothetical protein BHE74_00040378 [Ensete ventricosum]|nr:hypothetical protein BHE74_00040378 [Ensete ventricosum]
MDDMTTVFKLGFLCTETLPSRRPSMKEVLQILLRCHRPGGVGYSPIAEQDVAAPLLRANTGSRRQKPSHGGGGDHDDNIMACDIWALKDFSLTSEGCASSSECQSVCRQPEQLSHTGVEFWSMAGLQLSGVTTVFREGLPTLGRGTSFGRPLRTELSSFVTVSFHSSTDSSVIDTCTTVAIEEVSSRCDPSDC